MSKTPTILLSACTALLLGIVACDSASTPPEPSAAPAADATEPEPASTPAAHPGGVLLDLPLLATEGLEKRSELKGDAEAMKAMKESTVAAMQDVIGEGLEIPVEQIGYTDVFTALGAKVTEARWQPGENPNLIFEITVRGIQEMGPEAIPCDFLDADGQVIDHQDFYLPTGKRLFPDTEKTLVAYQTYDFHAYRGFAKIVVQPPSAD